MNSDTIYKEGNHFVVFVVLAIIKLLNVRIIKYQRL